MNGLLVAGREVVAFWDENWMTSSRNEVPAKIICALPSRPARKQVPRRHHNMSCLQSLQSNLPDPRGSWRNLKTSCKRMENATIGGHLEYHSEKVRWRSLTKGSEVKNSNKDRSTARGSTIFRLFWPVDCSTCQKKLNGSSTVSKGQFWFYKLCRLAHLLVERKARVLRFIGAQTPHTWHTRWRNPNIFWVRHDK